MSDEHDDDSDGATSGETTASDVQRGVQAGVSTIQNAASGNVAGALGGIAGAAGAVAGAVGGEAGQAVQTATQAAQAATQLAGAAQQLAGGNLGQAAGGLGRASSASQYLVPDHQAQQVLAGVGQAAGAAGALFDAAGGLLDGLGHRVNVEYHLELDGVDGAWDVRDVELHEQLSGTYECVVGARCDSLPEVSELLATDVHLQIERGERTRTLHGIVKHAHVSATDHDSESVVRLEIVPALWLLKHNFRSRTFTNKTIPQVVEEVFQERLGARNRTVRNELTRTYPVHELLVQYQETDLAFIQRRLEQEGIFFYFVHDGDHEELVLADTNTNLPDALESDGSRVAWGNPQSPPPGGECISDAVHLESVGATDVVVTTYNFTAPEAAPPKGEGTGRGELDPALEIYDHTAAVLLHDYQGTQYGANDATVQARMRAETLDLRRKRWNIASNLVAARPGHIIELTGCPDGTLDGRYVIVGVTGDGSATEGESGTYENHLQVIPFDVPFRPAPRTRVPKIGGFESAVVVGPSGEEIHTDEHGRVQVRFHWDRDHQPSEPSLCSCWMRVMHNWSGPGFGTTFIPRVGMEVVVAFVQGNADQPFVLGCLFHGTHHSPVTTPDNKTQSAIRTKSSPNSEGFNELRFEDKAGSEFIFTHAEKDYNEVVEHNHSTHVKNNQSNTVDNDQTETIGHDQTMTVKNDRTKSVDGNETSFIGGGEGGPGNRAETVWGNEDVAINQNRTHIVTKDETLTVQEGKRTVTVETGKDVETYKGGRETTVSQFDTLTVDGGANRTTHVTGMYSITSDGQYKVLQNSVNELTINDSLFAAMVGRVQLKAGDGVHYDAMPDGTLKVIATTKILFECGESQVELKADGTIKIKGTTVEVSGGASSVKLEGSGVTTSGPKITSSAQGVHEITGLLVKIN